MGPGKEGLTVVFAESREGKGDGLIQALRVDINANLLDLKYPGTAATAQGKAFHETIAHNFRQKRETTRDLPLAECVEFFGNVLGPELEEVKLQKDESPMELLELGTTMVAKYLGEAAPLIQPAAVESRVAGIIGGRQGLGVRRSARRRGASH
jgi:hypothetical protein